MPQKLLEFRYFMVPFVILQLFSIRRTSRLSIIYNLLVNAFTFYIFKTKGNFFMTLLDKSDFYLRNSMERYEWSATNVLVAFCTIEIFCQKKKIEKFISRKFLECWNDWRRLFNRGSIRPWRRREMASIAPCPEIRLLGLVFYLVFGQNCGRNSSFLKREIRDYEIGEQTGTGGTNGVWDIYAAVKKSGKTKDWIFSYFRHSIT